MVVALAFLCDKKKRLMKISPFENILVDGYYFPRIASIPGRTFPSMYSNIAPPPVET